MVDQSDFADGADDVLSGEELAPEVVGTSLSTSFIRTIVPLLVGLVVSLAAKAGLNLEGQSVEAAVSTLVAGLYYVAVRTAEEKLDPRFGWLLGKAAQPHY